MNGLLEKADAQIADLETKLTTEKVRIADAIAIKQIGEHYWQERDRIERKLVAARAVRAAIAEAVQ